MHSILSSIIKLGVFLIVCLPFSAQLQNLTANTSINITKVWSQAPDGYTYPIDIYVPTSQMPEEGFPLCILLHGNGGNGAGMINQYRNILSCHILVAPSGYENSWNICQEDSDAPDIEMFNELTLQLQNYSNVNPNKIRVLGSSNGAGLANRVFIENNNSGIDIVCAIVSHLNTAQFHEGQFYQPSNNTDASMEYCGYDSIANPLTTRKYLSISNDNDNLIPYTGGFSPVGVDFLDAETAAYEIAKYKGYNGSINQEGESISSTSITAFSYLSDEVVHIKGNAMHGTNESQRDYIQNYFSNCQTQSNCQPTISPSAPILCPDATDTLWTQTFDSYQWYKDGEIIENETKQYLVIDNSYSLASVQVKTTKENCQGESDQVLIDGWTFLLPSVTSQGNYDFVNDVHTVCTGDTISFEFNLPYNTNIQWTADQNAIDGDTSAIINITSAVERQTINYGVCGSPDICPDYVQCLGVPLYVQFINCQSVDIKEVKDNRFVYPNPAKDIINIERTLSIEKIEILNLSGQTCKVITDNLSQINIQELKKGAYIMRLSWTNGDQQYQKFIKN